jgi:RNA polymerase sigma-70 factor, ECF subfamily
MSSTAMIASGRDSTVGRADEEIQLAERLRAGDLSAFETLVRTHGGRLLVVAHRFLGCEAESADAVQDAFLAALESLPSFRGDARLGTWLHRIVVNCCLMQLRIKKRRRTVQIDSLLPQFDETGHHAAPVAAWQRPPHEVCCDAELRHEVRKAIDQLPDLHREILLLRDIDGLDTAKTASLLDVSESVVKTRLHRARQALRTLLEPVFASC